MEMGLLVQLHNYYQDLICTEEATWREHLNTVKKHRPFNMWNFSSVPKCLGTLKKKAKLFFSL